MKHIRVSKYSIYTDISTLALILAQLQLIKFTNKYTCTIVGTCCI